MNTFETGLMAVALAMDCFTVSAVGGVTLRQYRWSCMLRMAFLFGLFQALMPLAGWLGTHHFHGYIEAVDHWIAFGLLAFIGGKMIKESREADHAATFDPSRLSVQILLAIATSIDALAVGISMACLNYHTLRQLTMPLTVIGGTSFVFSMAGYALGVRCGRGIGQRIHPELLGGIILIGIGIKVLYSHLTA